MDETKEEREQRLKREANRRYREKYKERIKESGRIYREKNKEKERERHIIYREKNKEKNRESNRIYREQNKEKIKESDKEYSQTPQGKKLRTINCWKRRGLIHDDYDALYERYLEATHCEKCNIEFGKINDKTNSWKCMDHNHETGDFRNFLCNKCNTEWKDEK